MISRFSQLILASTVTTPLLLSISAVVIFLYPGGYGCGWMDLLAEGEVPTSFLWWVPTILLIVSVTSAIYTCRLLKRLARNKRGVKTIILSSLQPQKTGNILQCFALLPPWLTFLFRKELILVLVFSIVISLVITLVISRQGYSSLIFSLLGYKSYEGKNRNGMSITLISKRSWKTHTDIREIIPLTDNLALII